MKYLLVLFLSPLLAFAQPANEEIRSVNTGDIYEIIIKRPKEYDSSKTYNIVFFGDATINSGKTILSQDEMLTNQCILVGIGHKGDWSMKRQRDFIPSDAGGYNNSEFGQAVKFYLFIKNELIPHINKKFKKQKSCVFIGHSFGGLIALYMSLRDNKLFNHYYAISPSVWANHEELLKIEKKYAAANKTYYSNISLYAGSLEFLNKVLSSTGEFYDTVKKRNYKGLTITNEVIKGINHYGIVPKIIPVILKSLK